MPRGLGSVNDFLHEFNHDGETEKNTQRLEDPISVEIVAPIAKRKFDPESSNLKDKVVKEEQGTRDEAYRAAYTRRRRSSPPRKSHQKA